MAERKGTYYKLFSMNINGVKYYFIGSVKYGGYRWVFKTLEQAVEVFEEIEK